MNTAAERAPAAHAARARYRRGLLSLLLCTVIYSTGGFFTRLVPVDAWTTLFWRGLFSALFLAAASLKGQRGGWHAMARWPALLVALFSAAGMIGYISALKLTSVANVAMLYATSPLLTALVARLTLRERISADLIAAALATVIGVAIMVGGARGQDDLWGDAIALAMTILYAVLTVLLRHHRDVPMLPSIAVSSLLAGLVSLPFAAHPLHLPATSLFGLAAFGIIQTGLAYVLFLVGSRDVPAAENAAIGALEAPLAPAWVWLAFGEMPATTTFFGGTIVLVAISLLLFRRWRRSPAAADIPGL